MLVVFTILCIIIIILISGQYDWLHMEPSNTTTVTLGDTLVISCTFSLFPHNGITLVNDETGLSSDAMYCSSDDIYGKVVNYTCTANRSSIQMIKSQLTFCDLEFYSRPLTITIKERSG